MQRKAFNSQVFLEFVCYIMFAGLMFHLVDSDKYLSYVTPKMAPYLYFTATVMLIWSWTGLFRLFRPQHKTRAAHCLVLVIPIIFLFLPHNPISASNLSSGYLDGTALIGLSGKSSYDFSTDTTDVQAPFDSSPESALTERPLADNSGLDTSQSLSLTDDWSANNNSSDASANLVSDSKEGENAFNEPVLKVKNKKIIVQDDNFYPWLAEIYTNMEKYEGYQIVIKGFVFNERENIQNNEFVSARLMMSCCVADLMPCGIMCKYDKAAKLEADTWITVEGIIHIGQYMGTDEPQITVTKILPAQKPEQEYIYP